MKTLRVLLVALLLVLPSQAFAALAIDSQMPAAAGQGISSSVTLTFSFTNTAGTLLVCGVSYGGASALTVSSVTYAAAGMTQDVQVGYDGGTHDFAGTALFHKLTPATGANNVVVTMSATVSSEGIEAGCISFTGNDAVTPIVAGSGKTNFLESSTTSATVLSGTTTTGNYVVAQMATGTGYSSVTTGTLSWSKNQNTNSAGGAGAMTYASGTGGTITMSDGITSDFFGMVCLEVAAAGGGGGPTCTPTLGLMGVGRCG